MSGGAAPGGTLGAPQSAYGSGGLFSSTPAQGTSPAPIGTAPGDGETSVIGDFWNNTKEQFGWSDWPDDQTLTQSKYDFTRRVFPLDLEHSDTYNGHYVVININAQNNSSYSSVNGTPVFTPTGELSKTDALRFNIDNNFKNENGTALGQSFTSRPRFTRRIVESIALYMPNSELTFTDLHEYDNISLTKFAGSVAGGIAKFAGSQIGGIIGAFAGRTIGNAISGGVGGIVDGLGNSIGAIGQIAGTPLNPKVEVLFSNTFQREFAFDFMFAPANEKESIALEQIIRTIRFHAAPELKPGAADSFFYVPPSEFDLTFFYRGYENTKIPRINTCVLTQCDVSYAPSGVYSTFHNGHPVTARMMLRFRETEVNHKLRILQGF